MPHDDDPPQIPEGFFKLVPAGGMHPPQKPARIRLLEQAVALAQSQDALLAALGRGLETNAALEIARALQAVLKSYIETVTAIQGELAVSPLKGTHP